MEWIGPCAISYRNVIYFNAIYSRNFSRDLKLYCLRVSVFFDQNFGNNSSMCYGKTAMRWVNIRDMWGRVHDPSKACCLQINDIVPNYVKPLHETYFSFLLDYTNSQSFCCANTQQNPRYILLNDTLNFF